MHLPTIRARREAARTLDHITAQTRLVAGAHPREAAIQFLHDKIAAGEAGLDPYDATILAVQAHAFERVWAVRACELAGVAMGSRPWAGGFRVRAIVEADVRQLLGLDAHEPPVMADEPLASRALTPAERLVAADRATIDVVEAPAALARAHAAYEERQVQH